MSRHVSLKMMLLAVACLSSAGCRVSGKPGAEPEVPRPEQVTDFRTLYGQNCAACHGPNGRQGMTISLANPVYAGWAGEAHLRTVIAEGTPGTLMPAFAAHAGGTLTDQQVAILAHGITTGWGQAEAVPAAMPAYAADPNVHASLSDGEKSFGTFCARCHGENGEGKNGRGSLVDPTYLALVSDQFLRSTVVAGRPDDRMPDWQHNLKDRPMTDAEVTSIVAWLGSHRTQVKGAGPTEAEMQGTQKTPPPPQKIVEPASTR